MSMDITPLVPAGRQMIDSYGGGRFTVSGAVHEGSIIVFPDRTLAWLVADLAHVTLESLEPVRALREEVHAAVNRRDDVHDQRRLAERAALEDERAIPEDGHRRSG